MYAENQCLTKKTGTISLLIENSKIHINDGYSIELIFDNLDPEIAVSSIINHLDNENKKEKLNYKTENIQIFSSKKMSKQYSDPIANIKNKYKNVKVKTLDNDILQFQIKNLLSNPGINLLQGKFKVTKEYGHLLKLWKHSILLSVLLSIVVMIFFILENKQLSNQVEHLKTIFLKEYQVIAPNAKDIKDPRSIIRSLQLGNVSNKESGLFLNLLTKLSSSLEQTNNIQIQGISYRNEILDIRLLTPNIMMLDVVIQNINKSGDYESSIQSTDQVNEIVNSRIQIKRIMR
jgi:type II secretory pathway component PulL